MAGPHDAPKLLDIDMQQLARGGVLVAHGGLGALQVGLLVPRDAKLAHSLVEHVELLVVTVFLPLYFTNSGLKTQFGLINDGVSVGICVGLIAVSTIAKVTSLKEPANSMVRARWKSEATS